MLCRCQIQLTKACVLLDGGFNAAKRLILSVKAISNDFVPTRVIDVGHKSPFHRLVKPVLCNGKDLTPGTRYLTLSHRWPLAGQVAMSLKLTRDKLSSMMKSIPFDGLPKTFQDAITVTQRLGFRYLWIDSLCIIQDDTDDWQKEAALMTKVYTNSTCNLSATAASDGTKKACFFSTNPSSPGQSRLVLQQTTRRKYCTTSGPLQCGTRG